MKKIVTLILFLAVTAVYAQSFQISYDGAQVAGTIDFIAEEADDDNELVLTITNTSTEEENIYLTKYVLAEVPGSYNLFCIGDACYEASTSSTPLVLQPGESSDGRFFHMLYNPGGTEGTTTVKYVFTSGDYQDSVTVNYIYGNVGVEEAAVSVNSLTAYPNPATSSVTIAYDLSNMRNSADTRVVITNLVGSKVAVRPIAGTSGKVSMDISNLDSGIYFYSIESAGKVVSTKKLIVR